MMNNKQKLNANGHFIAGWICGVIVTTLIFVFLEML